MQHEALLLLALAKGIWAFEAGIAAELTPLADRVLAGEGLELLRAHGKPLDPELASQVHAATAGPSAGAAFRMGYYTDLDKVPAGSIAVVSMQGVILKNTYCGLGSMERAQRILQAGQHPNVAGILLDIDTPGGQVDGLSTVYDAITSVRALGKPVLGFINDGGCYSAGYNSASACTEIWASHATCGVGSIGVVCQFTDAREAEKKAGIKRIAVYASKSTEKNQVFQQAIDGNTAALTAELDEYMADFEQKVLSQRRSKIKQPDQVFKGQTYRATKGVQLGLIDTIGSMQQALARVSELAGLAGAPTPPTDELELSDDEDDDDEPLFSNQSMKQYPMLAALMGIAAKDFQNNAEGAHLQPVALDAIEARLTQSAGFEQQLTAATQARQTAEASLATATTQLTAKTDEVSKLQTRLATNPAATEAPKPGQEEAPKNSEDTPKKEAWEELDAEMLAEKRAHLRQFEL